ncbi:putative SAM dependent methyltransferase [Tieghemostelium lacteum]|uniref:Putative SAM dependent methyltransferase n=1 Tax=Tieghemostelium lacteum TaxID=361077 RepID=A0A152A187_TIELA|nr:putative SAM dependent methyltransferase [Tieghemostelium lacteum]|eukprot:KYQ99979.1 putative SAM dependent methyltransferase [Tieghemostelium lacteum]
MSYYLDKNYWDENAESYNNYVESTKFSLFYSIMAMEMTIGKEKPTLPIKLLDVATGTGPVAIAASKYISQFNPESSITAIDFSSKMIEQLDLNIKNQNINNIQTAVMDGLDLKLDDNTFDYGLSFFGLNLFSDRVQGMKEIHRVLKPGGQVMISTWTEDSFWNIGFRVILTEMGLDYKKYIPFSALRDPVLFESELLQAGFKDVRIVPIEKDIPLPNIPLEQTIKMFEKNPIMLNVMRDLNVEQQTQFVPGLIRVFFSMYPKDQSEKGFSLKSKVLLGFGNK